MKCRRKHRTRFFVKALALLLTPSVIAASASGIRSLCKGKPVLTAEKSPSLSVSGEPSAEYRRVSGSDLPADAILSEGYGISDESDSYIPGTRLVSPLAMTSADPGDKPYPTTWGGGGSVVRTTYAPYSGNCFFNLRKGGQVNNKTDIPNSDLITESSYLPNFTLSSTNEPQVLIYHTHTCESFEPYVRSEYDTSFNYRTTDETKNVVMVGDAIQAELEAQGIGVIHVRDIHDYPSYNGAYDRSRATILPILEKYPSIKVALDIHRDAISGEGVLYQPYIEVNGKEAAQIMIISGCDDGTLGMPDYLKNFHFACALQQQLESDTPGFTRPILFDYRKYNQDLTTGSLLIEVGTHGSTLEQVQYSGQLFGRSLGKLLNSLKTKE